MKDLIRKLVESYGPSGNEEEVRDLIRQEVEPLVDKVIVDPLGNLIAYKKGNGGKKIMVSAHMDEIGFIITHIDKNGFLRFANIGGIDPKILVSQRVRLSDGRIGVINHEKIKDVKELNFDKLFIDIGANDKESANISIGETAVYHRTMEEAGDKLISKAMDNRASCAVAVKALQELKPTDNEVYAVFTVQEEVGLRGAKTSAFGIDPDYGLAVDVTRTGDTPEPPTIMDVNLGDGPTVKIKDASILCHPKVCKKMIETAKSNNIPYQLEVLEHGGTDAGAIHLTKAGIPTGAMSIPCRYIHSPSEMISVKDAENGALLLAALLESNWE